MPVVEPPFWGARVIEAPPKAVVPFLNERSLYQFQWGFRKQGRTLEDFLGWAQAGTAAGDAAHAGICARQQDILRPQAAYGYWKAAGQGNDLIVFEQDGTHRTVRASPCRASRRRTASASPISSATWTTRSAT